MTKHTDKAAWLARSLVTSFIYYGLCVSEKAFHRELRRMGIPRADWPAWVTPGASATAHHFRARGAVRKCTLICLDDSEAESGARIAGLLVHEAMHLWREIRRDIGEKKPSSEFEAYAMQHISQELFEAYAKLRVT